jgi:RND family efflux transporter MFP subunit
VVGLLPSAMGAYADALVATAVSLSGARRLMPIGASGAGRLEPIKRRLQMMLSNEDNSGGARKTPRALVVLGMVSLPLLPASASGFQPQAPARDRAAPAQPAERPSPAAGGNARKPVDDPAPTAARSHEKPSPDGPRIRVKASQPLQREVTDCENLTGLFDSVMTVSVRPRVSGILVTANCLPGQKVALGDLLFQIDPRPYKAELERAQAEVRVAQARLEAKKAEALAARPPVEKEDRAKAVQLRGETKAAEASVQAAEKALELANLNLEFTWLRSPIDGNVIGPTLVAGNVAVADTTTLATIVSTDPMYVYFDVPQDIVLKLNRLRIEGKIKVGPGKGLAIRVGLHDENDFPRTGTLDSVNGSVDPGTGTARRRARVANRDGLILPGMFARVRLPIGEPHQALLVPAEAVWSATGEKYVNVVSEGGVLKKRVVTLRGQYDGMREIERGLKANEWVVVRFVQPKVVRTLPYGTKVDVEKVPMPEGAASGPERRQ